MRSYDRTLRAFTASAALLSACSGPVGDEPERAVPPSSASSVMPSLEPRPLALSEADRPVGATGPAAVADDGHVVYFHSFDDRPAFRIVDSTGAHVAGFGRRGEGPGELRLPLGIRIAGDTIHILDNARAMLVEFSIDGGYRGERSARAAGLPLAWDGDSMDVWSPPRGPDGEATPIERLPHDGAPGRVLVSSNDAALGGIAALARSRRMMVPPYASHDGQLYLADPFAYRIHRYDAGGRLLASFGRDLPPRERGPREFAQVRDGLVKSQRPAAGPDGRRVAGPDQSRRLDTLARETVPHFNRAPLHVDAKGRLWVVGTANDSTTIDVFADTVFLGRLAVPCLLSATGFPAALSDGWLLLQCRLPESAEQSWELQLYRVLEPGA